jgi:hypothetical protein
LYGGWVEFISTIRPGEVAFDDIVRGDFIDGTLAINEPWSIADGG